MFTVRYKLLHNMRDHHFVFSQLSWLSVDFNNWKDWEDDSDEEMGNFDQFSNVSSLH